MPMQKEEAERALQLLWEFMGSADIDDLDRYQALYRDVISGLHVYLTDILPASLPCLRARGTDGRVVEIPLEPNARSQSIDLYCNQGEKLGIVLDKVNLNGTWLSAGNQVSPIMVSLINHGSAAAKDGRLARGDQLLEIDGHPLSQCSLERARWLLSRAERSQVARLKVITSGLAEGLKHSVSRDFLDGKIVRQKRSKSMESLSRIQQTEVVVTAEVHPQKERRSLVPVPRPRPPPHRMKRQSSARSSHSSSFRNHPAYAPSIGSRRDSNVSLVSNTVETAAYIARTSFRRSEVPGGGFKKRKVRKMHIMKGDSGLGLRIVGGKGSKFGDMGIFVNKLEEGGAAFNDNRLRPGDELLMVNGKSLVGLTHNEAVEVLKATHKLVQLVVATESMEGESATSSLQSIPEAVAARRAYYSPHVRSFSPLSMDSSSTAASSMAVGPELQQLPQRNTFLKKEEAGTAGVELKLKTDMSLLPLTAVTAEGVEAETKFCSMEDHLEEPTSPMERSDQFEVVRTVTDWARTTAHKAPPPPEPEVKTIVYVKKEGKSLGFSICGGKGSRQGDLGILVRNIDSEGLAAQDGRLRRGDEIIDVNGKSLVDCTHKKAAGIIRSMKTGVVTLTVRTGDGTLPRGNTIKRSPSKQDSPSAEFHVTLVKEAGQPLGLQLSELKRDHRQSVVVIKKIAPNSPAGRCPNLKCNDQIVAVNSTSVAQLKSDKVRAFLSSLPPGQIRLTLLREGDSTANMASSEEQVFKDRSTGMGQANTNPSSSTKGAASTVSVDDAITVTQATPINPQDVKDSSEEENEPEFGGKEEEEDIAPEVPLAPPPIIIEAEETVEVESDAGEDERPHLHLVVQQTKPSRPESVLINIDGSLPLFESHHQFVESGREEGDLNELPGGLLDSFSFPPPPPSPPASENSDSEGDAPNVPTNAPPPIPDDSTFPQTGDNNYSLDLELPPILPPTSRLPVGDSALYEDEGLQDEPVALLPSTGPPPEDITANLADSLPPELPTTKPPLISDYSSFESSSEVPPLSSDDHLPLPSPLLHYAPPHTITISEPPPDDSIPSGFTLLEIDLKKRATSGLGITVESSHPPTSHLFMIRRIMAAGAAAKDGRLRSGDILIAVNGKSLANLSLAVVLQELNNAPKDCRLTIWRSSSLDNTPAAVTPTFTGSRTSLLTNSDEEDEGGVKKKRSLSMHSLDKSPLSVAKKLSAGRGISPRGSPLAHNRVQSFATARSNGSPLSKRWSAESVPAVTGPAGESLDLSPPPQPASLIASQMKQSPLMSSQIRGDRRPAVAVGNGEAQAEEDSEAIDVMSDDMLPPRGSPSSDTPPLPPGTPPTGDIPPQPPSTPPAADTPPLPPDTPPPPVPSAPPSTMVRGVVLDMSKIAEALGITGDGDSEDEEQEEAPPPIPQTTPPTTKDVDEGRASEDAPPPSPPVATHPSTEVDGVPEDKTELKEVERPKSLGAVPRGRRLEDAPFEIEVTKGLLGSLGMSVCENELGMIAVKALTNRSPVAKDGNIRIGDHLISINDESLLGKRQSEAEAIIKSLPRGSVRIVAMAPPRNVTNRGIEKSGIPDEKLANSTPSTAAPSKSLASRLSEAPSISPSGRQVVEEEGIVRVQLQRYGNRPLGFVIEGGSDTHLKYVYIQSLSLGSPASNCGLFSRGDQLVMVGDKCLVGITHKEAKSVLEAAPNPVEIVAQRKQSPKQIPKNSIPEIRHTKPSRSYSGSESDIPNAVASPSSNVLVHVSDVMDEPSPPHSERNHVQFQNQVPEQPQPPPPPSVMMVPEDRLTVQLLRTSGERLGLSIIGGIENENLPQVHVKKLLPDSVAGRNGKLKRGDRIVSVNGISLEKTSNKVATELLKNAGDYVTLVVARKIGRRVSTVTTPYESRLTSRRGSGDNTCQTSKGSSPKQPKRLTKMTSSSGENSREGSRGQTPPVSARRHNRRQSLGQSGEVLAFRERGTLPRKLGPKVGVRLVDLHKGPTGLGMQILGGKDRDSPITVKMVIPGGVAQKSGKIHPGDVILEANSISFESLTHSEAMKTLKGFPQGQVRLIIRDRTAITQSRH